jgi:hypothetical protein
MRARAGFSAALLALTFLAGCPRHARVERPYAPPTAAELLEAVQAQQAAVRTMNARARATSWLGGDRIRATVLMLVDRGGRLRLEAEVSLQGTVAVLATDGTRFSFLDVQHGELRSGPACPANVASLIRIALGPPDVAAILLGDARLPQPVEVAALDPQVDWDGDRGADVLSVRAGAGRLRYFLQRRDAHAALRLVAVTASDGADHPIWRAAFEDFTDVATGSASPKQVPLPGTIRYAEAAGSFDDGVEIKFKERTLNEIPAADAFALQPTAGIKFIEVGCPPLPP